MRPHARTRAGLTRLPAPADQGAFPYRRQPLAVTAREHRSVPGLEQPKPERCGQLREAEKIGRKLRQRLPGLLPDNAVGGDVHTLLESPDRGLCAWTKCPVLLTRVITSRAQPMLEHADELARRNAVLRRRRRTGISGWGLGQPVSPPRNRRSLTHESVTGRSPRFKTAASSRSECCSRPTVD